jgi:hypothetical protein
VLWAQARVELGTTPKAGGRPGPPRGVPTPRKLAGLLSELLWNPRREIYLAGSTDVSPPCRWVTASHAATEPSRVRRVP